MRTLSPSNRLVVHRPGFTLTEIIAVIAIIMVMTTLSFFAFTAAKTFGDKIEGDAGLAIASVNRNPTKKAVPPSVPPSQPVTPELPPLSPNGVRMVVRSSPRAKHPAPIVQLPANEDPVAAATRWAKLIDAQVTNVFAADQRMREPIAFGLQRNALAYFSSVSLQGPPMAGPPATGPGNDILWRTYLDTDVFKLHSNPGAQRVIYLDFDGHTVSGTQWNDDYNGGADFTIPAWTMSIDADRTILSSAEAQKIITMWRMVAEDFSPFDVDVTTEDPGLAALTKSGFGDTTFGIRVVIGPSPATVVSGTRKSGATNAWPPSGGIAYVPSFGGMSKTGPNDICCFVYNGDMTANPEYSLPDTVSHEVGHTLGLDHDGTSTLSYYTGQGFGSVSWGPIMGSPFGYSLTQWSQGEYADANNQEDDLAIISNSVANFPYRSDDHGDTPGTATALTDTTPGKLDTVYGVIEKNTDSDYFSFFSNTGAINIKIDPLPNGPNLDIKVELYASNGVTLVDSNNADLQINAVLTTKLVTAGQYFLKVTGTGRGDPLVDGYTNYGSLGNYRISGTIQHYTAPPPPPPPPPPTPPAPPPAILTAMNPVRWTFNPTTNASEGYLTLTNVGGTGLTGKFQIDMTLPENSLKVLAPSGTQTGTSFQMFYTGTLNPNQPIRLFFSVFNPQRKTLSTGYSTFNTVVTKL